MNYNSKKVDAMPRPRKHRQIKYCPEVLYFKPKGVPLRDLAVVELEPDELEALRLSDILGKTQAEAAGEMEISQSTFYRVVNAAHRKTADALVNGKAISIIERK
jgi:uncharacterized protein